LGCNGLFVVLGGGVVGGWGGLANVILWDKKKKKNPEESEAGSAASRVLVCFGKGGRAQRSKKETCFSEENDQVRLYSAKPRAGRAILARRGRSPPPCLVIAEGEKKGSIRKSHQSGEHFAIGIEFVAEGRGEDLVKPQTVHRKGGKGSSHEKSGGERGKKMTRKSRGQRKSELETSVTIEGRETHGSPYPRQEKKTPREVHYFVELLGGRTLERKKV